MDPFTISTIVVKLTATCLSTAKSLYDLRTKYNDSPLSIVTICSETTVISACLSHLQAILCEKQDFVQKLDSRPELAHTLDGALTGCTVLFSCLDDEIGKITAYSSKAGALSWKGKAKAVWDHERLRDLLSSLRGQQIAMNLLIQLVQLDSLGEIKQLLYQNRPVFAESIRRTQSLKQSHSHITFPASIYREADRESIYSKAPSITRSSEFELEFDFDDSIVNSKVYRRALASARGKPLETDQQLIEGDLIDLSDSQTIIALQMDKTTRDLEGLIISQDEQTLKTSPNPPVSLAANDVDQLPTFAWQEGLHREQIRSLRTLMHTQHLRPKSIEAAPVNVLGLISSELQGGGNRDISKTLQNKSRNLKKKGGFGENFPGQVLHEGEQSEATPPVKGGVRVAVQLMKCNRQSPRQLQKIYHEAAFLQDINRLNHPNIVRLYKMVKSEKYIGFIFEHTSGENLCDYINNQLFIMEDPDGRRLFAQLISGLGYLHNQGIVHRDLKLKNLLLDHNRNIIITGFASAATFIPDDKINEEIESNLSNLSKPYYVIAMEEVFTSVGMAPGDLMKTRHGEPIYAAPELVLSDALYTARKADIWSCGIILYAMLAGHLPFEKHDNPFYHLENPEGDTVSLVYRYIASTPLTFPEHITPDATDLLRRLIEVDPRKRASIVEVARHSWLKECEHLVGWIYRQSGDATDTDAEPNDGATAEPASPPQRRTSL